MHESLAHGTDMLLDEPLPSLASTQPVWAGLNPLPQPVRVLLADDHALVRAALRVLIDREPGMCVVGEVANGEAVIAAATELRPDVVVLDLSVPRPNGAAFIGQLVASLPGIRVLVLGADGVATRHTGHGVSKNASSEEFFEALRRAATEDAPSSATKLSTNGGNTRALSKREREVLVMIGHGQARKDMCRELNVSLRTVETYRARAMEKLHLKSRADIVRYVYSQGWLT
jgi:DNA-binding NarL/FixJ family response regulator